MFKIANNEYKITWKKLQQLFPQMDNETVQNINIQESTIKEFLTDKNNTVFIWEDNGKLQFEY